MFDRTLAHWNANAFQPIIDTLVQNSHLSQLVRWNWLASDATMHLLESDTFASMTIDDIHGELDSLFSHLLAITN